MPVLHFRQGLPGFPRSRRFVLAPWDADADPESPLRLLVDLDDPRVRFLVAPPGLFFPDYAADLDDLTVARLQLRSPEEALVLVIVTLGSGPGRATANLLGPVVVNTATGEGLQAVLADSGLSARTPLPAAG